MDVTPCIRRYLYDSPTLGPERTHGIRATYVDGCRCWPCRDAEAAYSRSRWHGRRERANAQRRARYAR